MFLQLVFCSVIGVYGVSSSCFEEIATCYNNSALSFNGSNSVLEFSKSATDALCSKKTELISLLKCVLDEILKCGDDDLKTIHPTNEMYEKTLTYLCSRINLYDVTCLDTSLEKIHSCSSEGSESDSSPTTEELKVLQCGYKKNNKKCITDSTELNECPETKATYLEIAKLQNPEACGGEAGWESGVFGSAAPMDPESKAPPLYQSVVLLTTITLMKIIF